MAEEKDERALEIEERMKAPLEWDSSANCKIQDLTEPRYDEALRLIKHHFFREDPVCKASSLLEDQSSVNGYLDLATTWIKDTTSLVALSLASGRVVGVAVTRINSDSGKTNVYSRVQIVEGETLQKILHLHNAVIRQTKAYKEFGEDSYFRIYILCVHPSYRERDVDIALLNACVQVAATLKIPAIGGIFTSGHGQSRTEQVGFRRLSEIHYSRWVVNDEVVFDDPGRGNYSAAFMGMLIPSEENTEDELNVSSTDATRKPDDPHISTSS